MNLVVWPQSPPALGVLRAALGDERRNERKACGPGAKAAPAAFQLIGWSRKAPSPLWASKWGWLFGLWDLPVLTSIYVFNKHPLGTCPMSRPWGAIREQDRQPRSLSSWSLYLKMEAGVENQELRKRDASQREMCLQPTKRAGMMEAGMGEQAALDGVLTGSLSRGTYSISPYAMVNRGQPHKNLQGSCSGQRTQ